MLTNTHCHGENHAEKGEKQVGEVAKTKEGEQTGEGDMCLLECDISNQTATPEDMVVTLRRASLTVLGLVPAVQWPISTC